MRRLISIEHLITYLSLNIGLYLYISTYIMLYSQLEKGGTLMWIQVCEMFRMVGKWRWRGIVKDNHRGLDSYHALEILYLLDNHDRFSPPFMINPYCGKGKELMLSPVGACWRLQLLHWISSSDFFSINGPLTSFKLICMGVLKPVASLWHVCACVLGVCFGVFFFLQISFF